MIAVRSANSPEGRQFTFWPWQRTFAKLFRISSKTEGIACHWHYCSERTFRMNPAEKAEDAGSCSQFLVKSQLLICFCYVLCFVCLFSMSGLCPLITFLRILVPLFTLLNNTINWKQQKYFGWQRIIFWRNFEIKS